MNTCAATGNRGEIVSMYAGHKTSCVSAAKTRACALITWNNCNIIFMLEQVSDKFNLTREFYMLPPQTTGKYYEA